VVAAEFIMERVPGVTVRAHHGKIQEKDASFYKVSPSPPPSLSLSFPPSPPIATQHHHRWPRNGKTRFDSSTFSLPTSLPPFPQQFSIVIAGLDNIKARIWLNSTLFSLAERNEGWKEGGGEGGADLQFDLASVVPLVDGGTEGFQGQARVVLPGLTACFHCTLDLFPPAHAFQLCTLADTPRQPEHCVAFAQLLLWPEAHPEGTVLDAGKEGREEGREGGMDGRARGASGGEGNNHKKIIK